MPVLIAIGAVLGILLFVGQCALSKDANTPLSETYAQQWSEPSTEVAATLARHNTRGCGEFYQKASTAVPGTFAVACAESPSNKREWTGYIVSPSTDEVSGPDFTLPWNLGGPPSDKSE